MLSHILVAGIGVKVPGFFLYPVPNIQRDLSLCWAGKGVTVRWNVQTLQDPEFAFLEP